MTVSYTQTAAPRVPEKLYEEYDHHNPEKGNTQEEFIPEFTEEELR